MEVDMTKAQKKTSSFPIVMTVKEQSIPKNYRVIGKLKSGDVIAVTENFFMQEIDERLQDID